MMKKRMILEMMKKRMMNYEDAKNKNEETKNEENK